MYKKGEIIIKQGEDVEYLILIYVGVVHLYGTSTWNDE